MESALLHPVVLISVFGYLNLRSLKNCREVCQKWCKVATRHFFNSDSRYCIRVHWTPVDLFMEYLAESYVTCGENYSLICLSHSERGQFLNKMKRQIKHLEFQGNTADFDKPDNNRSVGHMPRLQSIKITLVLIDNIFIDNSTLGVQDARKLADLISKAKNLQKLEMNIHLNNTRNRVDFICSGPSGGSKFSEITCHKRDTSGPTAFFPTLFGSTGLSGNPTFTPTLSSLTIKGDCEMNIRDLDFLRKLKLNLRYLELQPYFCKESPIEHLNALSRLLKDLSTTLETLKLDCTLMDYCTEYLEFLNEMKNLTTFSLLTPNWFPVYNIRPFLNQSPKLETFQLFRVRSSGVKVTTLESIKSTFSGILTFHANYSKLKEFKISSWHGRVLQTDDCPINKYIPKLFPNLKILEIPIYSINELYACIHDLKEMAIEELKIVLYNTNVQLTTDEPYTLEVPTLNTWKKLRKLNISLGDLLRRHVPKDLDCYTVNCPTYGISLEMIIPSTLTSLEMNYIGKFELNWLIALLQSLPLLIELKLRDGMEIVSGDKRWIRRSELLDRIQNDPRIHPHLWVCDKQF